MEPDGERDRNRERLRELETLRLPSAEDLDALVRVSLDLARSGRGRSGSGLHRARALLHRWREDGCRDPDLNLAEVLLTVSVPPAAALHRLRAMTSVDPHTASLEVVNRVFRCQLREAVDLAVAHGWFLDHVRATEGLCYALWAAGLLDRFEEAEAILEGWKRRHAAAAPETYQMVLQLESRLAHLQCQYARELAALQEAAALCEAFELRAAHTFVEPNLAAAFIRCGEVERANAIAAGWGDGVETPGSLLEGYRDMARLEMALLSGRQGRAERIGRRVRAFCRTIDNTPLAMTAEFHLTLSAPAARFPDRLARYRLAARRHQVPHHLRRVAVLERIAEAGARAARDVRTVIRTREGGEACPLVRVWTPRIDWTGADVFWNGVQGRIHLRGNGPGSLTGHPVLERMLTVILARPDFQVALPELFREVWGGEFDPLVHEGKVHVTVHRLRRWMDSAAAGAGGVLVLGGGRLGFGQGTSVRVLELESGEGEGLPVRRRGLPQRVVDVLGGGEDLPPRELEARLGVSRTALHHALRILRTEGRVERLGHGRAIRYRVM